MAGHFVIPGEKEDCWQGRVAALVLLPDICAHLKEFSQLIPHEGGHPQPISDFLDVGILVALGAIAICGLPLSVGDEDLCVVDVDSLLELLVVSIVQLTSEEEEAGEEAESAVQLDRVSLDCRVEFSRLELLGFVVADCCPLLSSDVFTSRLHDVDGVHQVELDLVQLVVREPGSGTTRIAVFLVCIFLRSLFFL